LDRLAHPQLTEVIGRGEDDYGNCRWFLLAGPILREEGFIHIAPPPILARLKRAHDRMLGVMEMFGGVLILRRVAAAHVATAETLPQMYPGIAHLQTFFAAFPAGLHVTNFFYVRTSR
jgi:hypothetical protein